MQLDLLKTEKLNIKVAMVKTHKDFYSLGFFFGKEQNLNTKNYYFSINLIFFKIALDIKKLNRVDVIYI